MGTMQEEEEERGFHAFFPSLALSPHAREENGNNRSCKKGVWVYIGGKYGGKRG